MFFSIHDSKLFSDKIKTLAMRGGFGIFCCKTNDWTIIYLLTLLNYFFWLISPFDIFKRTNPSHIFCLNIKC